MKNLKPKSWLNDGPGISGACHVLVKNISYCLLLQWPAQHRCPSGRNIHRLLVICNHWQPHSPLSTGENSSGLIHTKGCSARGCDSFHPPVLGQAPLQALINMNSFIAYNSSPHQVGIAVTSMLQMRNLTPREAEHCAQAHTGVCVEAGSELRPASGFRALFLLTVLLGFSGHCVTQSCLAPTIIWPFKNRSVLFQCL